MPARFFLALVISIRRDSGTVNQADSTIIYKTPFF